MSVEITGSRILAPFIGTSIIAWTSLIGVILASLSLGYYLGGKIADKYPKEEILGGIIGVSSLYLFVIGIFNIPILTLLRENITDLMVLSSISSLFLFGLPSVLLGMVTPYSVKLSLKSINKAGRVSGNLFAVSTAGSILGTFLTGLYLIPILGSSKLLLISSFLLFFSAFLILLGTEFALKIKLLSFFFLMLIWAFIAQYNPPGIGIYDKDSKYNRIILDIINLPQDERPVLALINGRYLDKFIFQSGMFLDNEDELVASCTKYYRLINHFLDDPKEVLMIGGGGYSYPRDFLKTNPESRMDVVEIDGEITNVAKEYFKLTDNSRLTIYHEDGRLFLNKNEKKYDAILLDVFSSDSSIPFYLTTKEAVLEMNDSLKEEGVIIVNMISAVNGKKGKFFQAEYNTFKEIFPQVYFFPLKEDLLEVQNIVLIASRSKIPFSFESTNEEYNEYLSKVFLGDLLSDISILTDDHAPVEYYLYERIK